MQNDSRDCNIGVKIKLSDSISLRFTGELLPHLRDQGKSSMQLIYKVIFLVGLFSSSLQANPFKLLNLDPTLFQLQEIKFNPKQSTGILSEYVLREMQNYPGLHGLTIRNLITYQEALAEKRNVVTTETLEYLCFQDEFQKRLNLDDILILRGYFLGSKIEKYKDQKELVQNFLKAALDTSRSSWVQFIAVLVIQEARRVKVDLGELKPNLSNVLQRAGSKKDSDAYFHFVLGHYYLEQLKNSGNNPYRRLRLVVSAFEASRTRDPRNRSLFTSITSSYISLHEELQEADITQPFEFEELVFRRIILLDPRNPWAHNNLAYLYCQHNVELLEALREARIANHLEKNNPYLMDTLGWALYKNKMYKDAEDILKKAISINPDLPDIHFHLATVYYDMKKFQESIESFKRTAELDPNSSLALNNLAYLYSEMGINLKEGLSLVERAIAMQPDNSAYLDTLGWIHFKLGNYKESVVFLKKAAELDPDSAETQYHLSQAYLKLGGTDESVKYLRKSMKLQNSSNLEAMAQGNLSQMILMDSIREARDKYLSMPNVPKDRTSLKVFYDQLIFLAQNMGDLSLVQKYAQELQDFPERDPALDANEVLHKHHDEDGHEHPHLSKHIEHKISPDDSVAVEPLLSPELTIRSFFPKDADFYLELGHESLSFVLKKLVRSDFMNQAQDGNPFLANPSFEDLLLENLPDEMAVYVDASDPKLKTQIYAVVKLKEGREQLVSGTLKSLTSHGLNIPMLNEQFEMREIDDIFHMRSKQFNIFVMLKNNFLIVSNSLIATRGLPYSSVDSLESNEELSSGLSSFRDQSAVLYCGNLSVLNQLNDENLKQFLTDDVKEFRDWLGKMTKYVSVVKLNDSTLEELEILSFKNAGDIPKFKQLLEKKSNELKSQYLKNSGVDLDSEIQISDDQLKIKTRVKDLNKFMGHFLNYLRDEGKKLLDNQNKNGEEQ